MDRARVAGGRDRVDVGWGRAAAEDRGRVAAEDRGRAAGRLVPALLVSAT